MTSNGFQASPLWLIRMWLKDTIHRSFTKHGRFAGNGQARLVTGQIVAAAEAECGAK